MFTGISFAYFGGKRKEESLTQRRRDAEGAEKRGKRKI